MTSLGVDAVGDEDEDRLPGWRDTTAEARRMNCSRPLRLARSRGVEIRNIQGQGNLSLGSARSHRGTDHSAWDRSVPARLNACQTREVTGL